MGSSTLRLSEINFRFTCSSEIVRRRPRRVGSQYVQIVFLIRPPVHERAVTRERPSGRDDPVSIPVAHFVSVNGGDTQRMSVSCGDRDEVSAEAVLIRPI